MIARLGKYAGSVAAESCFLVAQLITYPIDMILTNLIGLRVYRPRDFSVPPGTLILANHRSYFDPFLVTYHLGFRNILAAIPVRYPVYSSFMRNYIFGIGLRALGGYDIGVTSVERAKKLLFTRHLLQKKRTVLLFPEGKIVRDGRVPEEFQRGAEMLFAYDYPVIFARLSDFNSASFLKPFGARNASIRYSEVVRGDAVTKIARMTSFFGSDYESHSEQS